jgi:hypothetical protein
LLGMRFTITRTRARAQGPVDAHALADLGDQTDDKLEVIAAGLITQVRKSVSIDWTLRAGPGSGDGEAHPEQLPARHYVATAHSHPIKELRAMMRPLVVPRAGQPPGSGEFPVVI